MTDFILLFDQKGKTKNPAGLLPMRKSDPPTNDAPGKACILVLFGDRVYVIVLRSSRQPPIITVGHPRTIEPPCAVGSPIRAAGFPPIITVADPWMIESGGPTQTQESPTTAAGMPPINTVDAPGPMTGPPTWGIGGVPGVCMGQVCISVILAAIAIVQSIYPGLAHSAAGWSEVKNQAGAFPPACMESPQTKVTKSSPLTNRPSPSSSQALGTVCGNASPLISRDNCQKCLPCSQENRFWIPSTNRTRWEGNSGVPIHHGEIQSQKN